MAPTDEGLFCPCLCGADPPVPSRMLQPMEASVFRAQGAVFLDGAPGVSRAQMERQDRVDEMNDRLARGRERKLLRSASRADDEPVSEAADDDDPDEDDGDDR